MNAARAREAVQRALRRIAPEVDPAALDPGADLREQVDMDSMDLLNFLIELARETGIEVPEEDYARVRTIDQVVGYLVGRSAAGPPGGG